MRIETRGRGAALRLWAGCAALVLLAGACAGEPTQPEDAPATILVDSDTIAFHPGDVYPVHAVVYDGTQRPMDPQPALTWSSADVGVARAEPGGTVVAGAFGATRVTVAAGRARTTIAVSVTREPTAQIVVLRADGAFVHGADSLTLPATAAGRYLRLFPDRPITWASLDPALATVSSTGVVRAVGVGSARITASNEGVVGTALVQVDARRVATITLAPDSVAVITGARSGPIAVTVRDAAGATIPRRVTWTSLDTAVATPFSGNSVYGWRAGLATVAVTADGVTARLRVLVRTFALASASSGYNHGCGTDAAGAAYCWGANYLGQLGGATASGESAAPVAVSGGVVFASVVAGEGRSCGRTSDGTVYCWGGHDGSQPGDSVKLPPRPIPGAVRFTSITIGSSLACGLDAGGAAYCWGTSSNSAVCGTLNAPCLGTQCTPTEPTRVAPGRTFTQIVVGGSSYLCGLEASGAASCWGRNNVGQLGTGSLDDTATPTPVAGGLTFKQLAASGATTCGVTTGGAAYCWGSNEVGALGTDLRTVCSPAISYACSTTPVAVSGGLTFASVGVAGTHACALTGAGAAHCWGAAAVGGGNDGGCSPTAVCSFTPVAVPTSLRFASVSVGAWNDCAIATDGKAYCWRGTRATPSPVLGQQ